jgi:hypothetical protein
MGQLRASLPRFKRTAPSPRISLTSDDIEILRHVHRHRFISAYDLYRLCAPRAADRVSRRLTTLFRAGLLDRPICQVERYQTGGSKPIVYGLTVSGRRALVAESFIVPDRDYTNLNRSFTRPSLDHTTATARFLVDVEIACKCRTGTQFLRSEEIISDMPRWRVELPWRGNRAEVLIVPDGLFGIARTADSKRQRSFYFLEIDRGSMAVAPSERARRDAGFLYRSSILRKLLSYAVSHREQAQAHSLGLPPARTLFVTTNASRAEAMRQAAETLVYPHFELPSDLFLFGAPCADDDPLTFAFRDITGRPTSIFAEYTAKLESPGS